MSSDIINEAELYEEISSIEREDGLHLIELATPTLGSRVLDLGCGTGSLSNKLACVVGPTGKVVAIDPNSVRLEMAAAKYSASNLCFKHGAAENIPEGNYDLIFTNHVLHWCKDRSRVFAQIASSLKSNGKFACNCVAQSSEKDDTFDFVSAEHKKYLSKFVDENEFGELISKHNFVTVHKSRHECVHTFNDKNEYISFFCTHQKFDKTDFNLDVLDIKLQKDGFLLFKYEVLTYILIKQ